jgi:uncharacterized membrane protein YjfL (UPF0719 family)
MPGFRGARPSLYVTLLVLFGAGLVLTDLYAADVLAPTAENIGFGLALLGGVVQLIIGIAFAVLSISIGLRILTRVLPAVNVVEALKARNTAVGAMAAGVVIAYTKVISTGIKQIGESISVAPSLGGFAGGVVNVLLGVALASLGVTAAFKALNRVTPSIKIDVELNENNLAVGLFVTGVLFGISEMIAAAVSGIGQAMAGVLSNFI